MSSNLILLVVTLEGGYVFPLFVRIYESFGLKLPLNEIENPTFFSKIFGASTVIAFPKSNCRGSRRMKNLLEQNIIYFL